jgi:hypothetical protein
MKGSPEEGVFQGMAGKRITAPAKETPEAPRPRALPGSFSRLTWLSLVGLHPCRAQLRFTRQPSIIPPAPPIRLKIDKSASRLARLKIDKSAYRVGHTKHPKYLLEKPKRLV